METFVIPQQAASATASTYSPEASPARTPASERPTDSASPEHAPACSTSSPDFSTNTYGSQKHRVPDGLSSKTRKVYSSATRDETWRQSPPDWGTSGMGSPTEWWTDDTS